MKIMRLLGLYFLIFGLLSCGNQSKKTPSNETDRSQEIVINERTKDNDVLEAEDLSNNSVNFDGVILNSELSIKFDSILNLYNRYNQKQTEFDSLMVFKKRDQDTLIRKLEVQFIESCDPNAAFYLFGTDTIIGGNGYCASDYYLLSNGKLSKIINQFADCVESSSSTKKEICFDSEEIKWFYFKDIEDVGDMYKYEQGFQGSETEIIAYYNSNRFQFAIQKIFIDYRSDMNLIDTLKYELIKYEDFNYLIPKIRFGFEIKTTVDLPSF